VLQKHCLAIMLVQIRPMQLSMDHLVLHYFSFCGYIYHGTSTFMVQNYVQF